MADYNVTMTSTGAELLAKCLAGKVLQFTGVQLGNGDSAEAFEDMTALVSVKKTLPVNSIVRTGAKANVKAVLDYTSITEDFQWKEVGLIAVDPDTGDEVLYCYGNAGNKGDWITGGTTATAKSINLTALVSNTASVTAVIDNTIVYAAADLSNVSITNLAVKIREVVQDGELSADALGAIDADAIGQKNGVASLDSTGKVPPEQLPAMDYDPKGSAQAVQDDLNAHAQDTTMHITENERTKWSDKAKAYSYTATIPASGWGEMLGAYAQEVDVPGITADMTPTADVILTGDMDADKLILDSWACVSRIETGAGKIRLTCYESVPEANIPVQLVGVV